MTSPHYDRLLSSIVIALILGAWGFLGNPAWACGHQEWCPDTLCRFAFAPEIIESPDLEAFFYSESRFYGEAEYRGQQLIQEANLASWVQASSSSVDKDTWKALIYETSLPETQSLRAALAEGSEASLKKVSPKLAPLLHASDQGWLAAALDYLQVAKMLEPRAPAGDSVTAIRNAEAKGVPYADIRARYQFLKIKQAFVSEDYAALIASFAQWSTPIKSLPHLYYQAMSYLAGAYRRTGRVALANYYYSTVFREYPPMRPVAEWSFHPQEERDWNESLQLAKTPREKISLWLLLGIYADGLRAINEILKLNPQDPGLALLMVREISAIEEAIERYRWLTSTKSPDRKAFEPRLSRTLAHFKAVLATPGIDRPYLWQAGVGYLLLLSGKTEEGKAALQRAAQLAPATMQAKNQIRALQLYAKTLAAQSSTELAALGPDLNWLNTQTAVDPRSPEGRTGKRVEIRADVLKQRVSELISRLFAKSQDDIRAELAQHDRDAALYNDNAKIASLIKFTEDHRSKSPSTLDEWLAQRLAYNSDQLHYLLAANHTLRLNFGNSAEEFAKAGKLGLTKLHADARTVRLTDCHECDRAKKDKAVQSPIELMQTLVSLSSSSSPENLLLRANILYNLSWGPGNVSDFWGTNFSQGSSEPRSWWEYSDSKPGKMDTQLLLEGSKKLYGEAMSQFVDREKKAQALFYIAKVEQALFELDASRTHDIFAGSSFQRLKEEFSGTEYYKQAIRECGYFKKFAERDLKPNP